MKEENRIKKYLEEEDKPAQEWYKKEGEKWIRKYIPTSAQWIRQNYDKANEGIYCIEFNNKCVYIGQSDIVANRLIVHAWHLAKDPQKYFGILTEEIEQKKIKIFMKCLETGIGKCKEREIKEMDYICNTNPILQKNDGTDRCISRRERRSAILEYVLV